MEKTKQKNNKRKLIVILGPTASGKSELAVKLALRLGSKQAKKQFRINGAEIISADSRQVYKGMDIGTGKITRKEMKGIPHYCIDVASPKRKFTVAQYRKLALKAIDEIFKKNKIPILCGGSGFYIEAVTDGIIMPEVRPDWKLRKNLEKKTVKELYQMLKKLDPQRAKTIEKKNPRRLIRAIEIAKKIGRVPAFKKNPLPYSVLLIGIKKEKEELKESIKKSISKRIKKGMVEEVKNLRKAGVSWKRLEEFGLEYRLITHHLRLNFPESILKKPDFFDLLQKETEHFARRQMNWWKSNKKIKWIKKQPEGEETKVSSSPFAGVREAEKLVKKFLEK